MKWFLQSLYGWRPWFHVKGSHKLPDSPRHTEEFRSRPSVVGVGIMEEKSLPSSCFYHFLVVALIKTQEIQVG